MKPARQQKFSIALAALFASRTAIAASSPETTSSPIESTIRDVARWLSSARKDDQRSVADRRRRRRLGEGVAESPIETFLGLADDDELVETVAGLLDDSWTDTFFDLDLCTLVESAMGDGNTVEASCSCLGDLEVGVQLHCSFESTTTDGSRDSIDLELFFGGLEQPSKLDLKACARFAGGESEEPCFSYHSSNEVRGCSATYGDQNCSCSFFLDDVSATCLSIDCSPLVPGVGINTCGTQPESQIFRPPDLPAESNQASKLERV